MKRHSNLEDLLRNHEPFTYDPPDEIARGDQCEYARHFAKWVKKTCQKAVQEPSLITINRAMLLLVKKYFEWREAVPPTHRNRVGENGHVCIFHIFERAYQRLKVEELALTPPMLFEPVQPQITNIKNITKYDGFVIGETVVDEDEDY